ncbi:MAG: 4-(cytidine 5'-diphospho)-2-C-methyl-D-erythritol kinase [Heliobacteriaceae bacterium]|nr:4-(cytidine 5'-diphospho)-2-C-methyl-D-erythritol kinase [Heliobacteriaceae bacterium]
MAVIREVRVKAPAKINLSIDVLGRRPDGYHQVAMVMQTIDLFDQVTVSPGGPDRPVVLCGGCPEALPDAANLVYKTAVLVREKAGLTTGVAINLEKRIPVAAGLAGGSSDAAATMKAMNQLFSLGWSPEKMAAFLARLGSDIPFLVWGGTALATGRGELIHRLPPAPEFWVVLIKPPFGVATPRVYQALGANPLPDPPPWPGEMTPETVPAGTFTAKVIAALRQGSYPALLTALGNDLEPVTLKWHPELTGLKQRLVNLGCDRALMAGSGPTLIGLVAAEDRARDIAAQMAAETGHLAYRVMVARSSINSAKGDAYGTAACSGEAGHSAPFTGYCIRKPAGSD